MIRDIWTPSLVEILPPSILRDSKLRASAEALDLELQKLSLAAREALLLPRLDELPHAVLDQLASQYHVDFYEPTEMDLETKRKLIRNSIYEHRIKGTKFAVENLLSKITAGAEVQEWFEYNGRPYYFRVNLKGLRDYDDNGETFMRMIEATKNARSWLDDIIFDLSKEHPDQILNVALINLLQGWYFYDQRYREKIVQPVRFIQCELLHGVEQFDICGRDTTIRARHVKHTGIAELVHGKIRYDFENEIPDEDTVEKFERYMLRRWQEFNLNPIVEQYRHGLHGPEAEPVIAGDITRKSKHKLRIGFGELIRGSLRFTPDIQAPPPEVEDIVQQLIHPIYSDITEQTHGEISYDLGGETSDITQRLTHTHYAEVTEQTHGEISYPMSDNIGGDITQRLSDTYRSGIFEGTSGEVRFGDISPDITRKLSHSYGLSVAKRVHGTIRFEFEGFTADEDDDEIIPIDRDFLRLYWKFPVITNSGELKTRIRTQTILDPRQDLTASEIKSLSKVGTSGEIFVWGKDNIPTTGILRATYIHKKETKII